MDVAGVAALFYFIYFAFLAVKRLIIIKNNVVVIRIRLCAIVVRHVIIYLVTLTFTGFFSTLGGGSTISCPDIMG